MTRRLCQPLDLFFFCKIRFPQLDLAWPGRLPPNYLSQYTLTEVPAVAAPGRSQTLFPSSSSEAWLPLGMGGEEFQGADGAGGGGGGRRKAPWVGASSPSPGALRPPENGCDTAFLP